MSFIGSLRQGFRLTINHRPSLPDRENTRENLQAATVNRKKTFSFICLRSQVRPVQRSGREVAGKLAIGPFRLFDQSLRGIGHVLSSGGRETSEAAPSRQGARPSYPPNSSWPGLTRLDPAIHALRRSRQRHGYADQVRARRLELVPARATRVVLPGKFSGTAPQAYRDPRFVPTDASSKEARCFCCSYRKLSATDRFSAAGILGRRRCGERKNSG